MLLFIEVENYPHLKQTINTDVLHSIEFVNIERISYKHLRKLLIKKFTISRPIRELRLRKFNGPANQTCSFVINSNTNLGSLVNNDTIIIAF